MWQDWNESWRYLWPYLSFNVDREKHLFCFGTSVTHKQIIEEAINYIKKKKDDDDTEADDDNAEGADDDDDAEAADDNVEGADDDNVEQPVLTETLTLSQQSNGPRDVPIVFLIMQ